MNRLPWAEELDIIDRLMRTVSSITDPEEMVSTYWAGIPRILPADNFLALSRRGVKPPEYLITRSSRFPEELNPWTQRDRLPRLAGGLLGEIAYAERTVIIDDLPARLNTAESLDLILAAVRAFIRNTPVTDDQTHITLHGIAPPRPSAQQVPMRQASPRTRPRRRAQRRPPPIQRTSRTRLTSPRPRPARSPAHLPALPHPPAPRERSQSRR